MFNVGKTIFTGSLPELWLFALGALFVATTLFLPRGILGVLDKASPTRRMQIVGTVAGLLVAWLGRILFGGAFASYPFLIVGAALVVASLLAPARILALLRRPGTARDTDPGAAAPPPSAEPQAAE